MVSTIRFRSFKSFDLQARRPFRVLILAAIFIVLLVTHPQAVLVVLAYGYLASAFIGMAISNMRRRGESSASAPARDAPPVDDLPRTL
jgi:phosphatidylserine synthase